MNKLKDELVYLIVEEKRALKQVKKNRLGKGQQGYRISKAMALGEG